MKSYSPTLLNLKVSGDQTLVFLVRHGETGWNRERRIQGQLDVPLAVTGLEQAAALGDWFGRLGVPIAAVYTSDLERAKQTADALAKGLDRSPVPAHALREIHCGDWQGLLASDIEAAYPEEVQLWRSIVDKCAMVGGESLRAVQERMFAFYNEVVEKHTGQAIILVTHGAALSALVAAISGVELEKYWRERRLRHDNTGVTIVLQDRHSYIGQILHTNLVGHLERTEAEVSSSRE